MIFVERGLNRRWPSSDAPGRPSPPLDLRHRSVNRGLMLEMLAYAAWPREMARGGRGEALAGAAKALDIVIEAELGYARGDGGEYLFDPVEVEQFLDWSARAGFNPLWGNRQRLANLQVAAEDRSLGRSSGAPSQTTQARRFKISFQRVFDLGRFPAAANLRLRLPAPLRCGYHRDIVVTPVVPPSLGAEWVLSEGRLDIRLMTPTDPAVEIAVDMDILALLPGGRDFAGLDKLDDADVHLRAAEGFVRITPRIRSLALRLAGSRQPIEAVVAFWTYIAEEIRFGFVRYDEIIPGAAPDWVVDNRAGDCQLCVSLLVSLCRARDIPARVVTGHYLNRLAPTNHAWAEIWIDDLGWTPLDMHHLERDEPQSAIDSSWPEHFARRLDYRLAFQRLPLEFTGPMSVRFPVAWQMLHTSIEGGVAISYLDIADGSLIHQDRVRVEPVG
jgi:hypothetical protein